mmetsp:Transcript_16005/g.34636  ORF Transcript_16005/g.34636 Transcript_16005/m.34636 type:complete len:138 (+) Transcript_16005:61-474(+)
MGEEKGEVKEVSRLELMKHASKTDCWMSIDGKVYDVTKFLVEHPGGEDIMVDSSGRDATREFEDVGHSGDARSMLSGMLVGTLREDTPEEKEELDRLAKEGKVSASANSSSPFAMALKLLFPVIIIALAYVVRKYTS